MKTIVQYSLIVATFLTTLQLEAMKRKYPEVEEKEKGSEEQILGAQKKPRIIEKIGLPKLQPLSLKFQAARKAVDIFLNLEIDEMVERYNQLIPEMKEYIQIVINTPNNVGELLLHKAKNADEVNKLIYLGTNTSFESRFDQDPLLALLERGHIQAAEALLNHLNDKPTIKEDMSGFTSLHYALIANAPSIVRRILKNPETPYIVGNLIKSAEGQDFGRNLLHFAEKYSPASLKLLKGIITQIVREATSVEDVSDFIIFLESQQNTQESKYNEYERTCSQFKTQNEVDLFLQMDFQEMVNHYNNLPREVKESIKIKVNEPNNIGEIRLHNAKNIDEVRKLLFLGSNFNLKSRLLKDPFLTMLKRGHVSAAEALLDFLKIEPSLKPDLTGFTSLHYALMANAVSIVKRILKNPNNKKDLAALINEEIGHSTEVTPLILAAMYSPRSIKPLVNHGALVDVINQEYTTPLLAAAAYQPKEVLELLISLDADIFIADEHNFDILQYAVLANNNQVLNYIIKTLDLNPNSVENIEESPEALSAFELAVQRINDPSYHETIRILLENGGDPNTDRVNLAVLIPQAYSKTGILKIFIDYGASVNYMYYNLYPLASAIFEVVLPTNEYGNIRKPLNYDLIEYLVQNGAMIQQEHLNAILKSNDPKLIEIVSLAPIF